MKTSNESFASFFSMMVDVDVATTRAAEMADRAFTDAQFRGNIALSISCRHSLALAREAIDSAIGAHGLMVVVAGVDDNASPRSVKVSANAIASKATKDAAKKIAAAQRKIAAAAAAIEA